jgi:serine/threonine-protein kinase
MNAPIDTLKNALSDRYRIERELGMGGMATVYLADDLKHDRKVALKVLKPELAAVLGAERFVVEIKTTASLQHPHILPLFDSGTAGGFLFYVMPYIEGETLRSKLSRETQLGIDEAVRIAREVADALDYAHRHGVIHRDIKPENILLHDGRPMVADFGIALAVSAAAGGRMTETGLSLGTPHYMSPEQATAEKEITARSDVYSLASVLYEMLAGEPPHMGNSAQQIIMKIIAEPVQPVTKLRKSVPENVAAALMKALEKLPADRFESAKAFANALGDATFTMAGTSAYASGVRGRANSRTTVALAAACVLFAGVAIWEWVRGAPQPAVMRYQLPESMTPAAGPNPLQAPVAAPGGSLISISPIVLNGVAAQLWIKRRDSHVAVAIPGSSGVSTFTLSPDGASIAFTTERGELKTIPVGGGVAVTLSTAPSIIGAFGVAWLDDGTIVYVAVSNNRPSLMRVKAGEQAQMLHSDSLGLASGFPSAIAGHNAVLFDRCASITECDLWVLDTKSGAAKPLMPGVFWAQYATSGHIVFERGGRLLAAPFDAVKLELRGDATGLADSIATDFLPISLSRSGTLVTRLGSGTQGVPYEMVWVDRKGTITPVDTAWKFFVTRSGNSHGWAISRDGTRVAIGLATDAGDDIYVKQLPHGPASRVSLNPGAEIRPRWTPDDRAVTFVAQRLPAGIYVRPADATGKDSLLLQVDGLGEAIITADGQWLLYRTGGTGEVRDIWGKRLHGDTARVPLFVTPFEEDAIMPSPDSKWVAYQSNETGRTEIFIRSFPNTDGFKRQVSNAGGEAPLWSRDGHELFYMSANHMMTAVRIGAGTSGATLSVGDPAPLFHIPDDLLQVEYAFYTPWDVAGDGRFMMARALRSAKGGAPATVVAENWLQELRAKMKR